MAKELIVTPRGVAVYPRLSRPDTKFKEEGEYKVTLRISEDDAQDLIETLSDAMTASLREAQEEAAKDAAKKGRRPRSVKQADPPWKEDPEVPGFLLITFKMRASGVERDTGRAWTQKPSIVDARGKIINNDDLNIGSGSEGKVSFFIQRFATPTVGAGISLKLKGFQLLKLVEYSGGMSAAALGFGQEEGGYEYNADDDDAEENSGLNEAVEAGQVAVPDNPDDIPAF